MMHHTQRRNTQLQLSTTEAEYMALTEGAKQLIWRWFIQDLSISQSQPNIAPIEQSQCDYIIAWCNIPMRGD